MNERSLAMLESRVREAVSDGIRSELNDPRIEKAFPSITTVKLAPDLSVVHVSVSIFGDDGARRACWRGIQSGRRRLQGYLARRLKTRTSPELVLHLDESLKKAADVLRTIHDNADDLPTAGEREPDSPPERETSVPDER